LFTIAVKAFLSRTLSETEGDWDMENKKGSGRRGFLKGVLVAAGATSATILTAGKALAKAEGTIGSDTSKGPILYRRTEEAERYYKTLYN
jgi:hypothetical protein